MTIYQADDEVAREAGTVLALAGMRRGDVVGMNGDSAYVLACDAFSDRKSTRLNSSHT